MSHGRNFKNQRNLQGRISSTKDLVQLDEIFKEISGKSPIDTCKVFCPMYENGICKTLGTEAPVGEDCLPQKFSKERK